MNTKPDSPALPAGADPTPPNRLDQRPDQGPDQRPDQRPDHGPGKQSAAARPQDPPVDVRSLDLDSPPELPIAARADEIIDAIRRHDVIVVCGETGSGKSTQLPKLCLRAGLGTDRMIGHTQPRRLAAREVAARIADELKTPLGEFVGYQVRFGDQTTRQTRIKLMTDGILLAETQSDPSMKNYDAIIIDEAHERSLNIDFLLGYLRRLQDRRSDLKIIITSATIDADRFAEHFATPDPNGGDPTPAPIINVEGRGFPVETVYLSAEEVVGEDGDPSRLSTADHVIAGLECLSRRGNWDRGGGDTLVFLPTERDIREVSHRVGSHYQRLGLDGRYDLLPLYARLPQSQQRKIFRPDGKKPRVIFATNVAESSLTVPGIHAVVDTGTARISRYATRSRVQRLPVERVSQASANQRAGRCGRIGPGTCVRLYSLQDFESRDAYTMPEIRRTNLASVVLTMKSLRLGPIAQFPFLDPPRPEAIRDANKTLVELGAIDNQQDLTGIGVRLGRMPVDPRVGRMLIAADDAGTLPDVLPIAASIEIPDPRDRPIDKQQAADEAHAEFIDPRSDFLTLLNLWRHYQSLRSELSRGRLERTLRKQFLSPSRMREWSDVHRQLRDAVKSVRGNSVSGRRPKPVAAPETRSDPGNVDDPTKIDDARSAAIHGSLLTGLLDSVAMIGEKNLYTAAGGLKVSLWPGSGLAKSKPKWIMAAELVETSKTFARTAAKIQPAWIEQTAGHLIRRHHVDPHWSDKAGGAFCYENQTLYGLPVVLRRRVPLPPIDPVTARDLMIEHGLAERKMRTTADFVVANRRLRDELAAIAAKTRNRDLVIDPYQIIRFYSRVLPAEVCDRGRLEKYARAIQNDPSIASVSPYATAADFMETPPDELSPDDFPDQLSVGPSVLPLDYRYTPGDDRDGINVKIHAAAVTQISDARLDWLVPGMLHDKIVAMIKSLPKRLRRNLVPAADVAAAITESLMPIYGTVPFESAVCREMTEHAGVEITPDDFQPEKLSDHLRMLVTVVDDDGQTIAEGRRIDPLVGQVRRKFGNTDDAGEPADAPEQESWRRKDMQTFDIDRLPATVRRVRGGVEVAQFPGLRIERDRDGNDRISTKLFPDKQSAERSLSDGLTRLFAKKLRKELSSQVRHLPALANARLKIAGMLGGSVQPALVQLLARLSMVEGEPPVRTAAEFDRRLSEKPRRVAEATVTLAGWLASLSEHGFNARREIEQLRRGTEQRVIADIAGQTKFLQFEGWIDRVPWQWMQHYPRYYRAIAYRIDKLRSGGGDRDQQSTEVIADLTHRLLQSIPDPHARTPADVADIEPRWLIEELRVSLFAQPLGTALKVSPVRVEKAIKKRTSG